jgi:hypothetical protein
MLVTPCRKARCPNDRFSLFRVSNLAILWNQIKPFVERDYTYPTCGTRLHTSTQFKRVPTHACIPMTARTGTKS